MAFFQHNYYFAVQETEFKIYIKVGDYMRSIFNILFILFAVTPIFSGSRYPVILPEITDSLITYTYKGVYKKHKNMQTGGYSKQLYRAFKRNIESCSELYCLINDSLDIQFKKESSGKNVLIIPESGFEKTGAELIILFQSLHVTLNSQRSTGTMIYAPMAGPGFGVPGINMAMGGNSGFSTSIKISAVISVFRIKENNVLFTKKITSKKSGGNPDTYAKSPDEEIERNGSIKGNEIEEAVHSIARKLIKNTAWEVKNKHPEKEIVE